MNKPKKTKKMDRRDFIKKGMALGDIMNERFHSINVQGRVDKIVVLSR
ncbi:MAG: hypothetical protein IEMM0008_1306 [bacterium]|nr:MAG: hypothetical protein IEMM0008_1306 [bacterium]